MDSTDGQAPPDAMDDIPHDPPSASSAPLARSRITVVCAECKRLKLKCDRRTPCGSCTKRGTVSRCIYSPAAAEKVDLHSLNNRLIQVEAILAMVTAGQTPPPFQSTYPLAQVALPPSHSETKPKPGHATIISPPPSISVRFDDLATIWLCHSQLDSYGPIEQTGHGFEIATDGTFVKVEVSPTDILPPPSAHPRHGHDHTSKNHHSPASLQFELPPLYAYYPSVTFPPSPSSTVIQLQPTQSSHYSSSSSQNSPHHAGPSTGFPPSPPSPPSLPKPAASNALFSFLPSPATRIKLLNRARIAHPHIVLVTPWNRLVALADPSSKDEKGKRTALATAVFFNANRTVESPGTIRAQVPPSSFMTSKNSALPIFISLCYALALGALEADESPPVDPAFLYALAGQALGVWEEFWTSDTINGRDEVKEREGRGRKRGGQSRDELDYVAACLLQVKYMMRLGSSAAVQGGVTTAVDTVFPLIGKLVNLAHSLGLAHDPDELANAPGGRTVQSQERRRLIWWDIMFYDTFLSDALGHPSSLSLYSYSTDLPAIAQPSSLSKLGSRASNRPSQADGEQLDSDYYHMADDSESDDSANKEFSRKFIRRQSPLGSKPVARKGKDGASAPSRPDDTTVGFFGVRCQLVRLVHIIKHRLSSTGCECCTCRHGNGYTLDEAVALEGDIRTWVAELPVSLKLESPPEPKPGGLKSVKHAAFAAELAIMANRLIIAVYLPLMRPTQDPSTGEFSRARTYAAHPWSPASRATVDAAQCVVRAGRVLHRLLLDPSDVNGSLTMIRDYYPLSKAVLDATIICAHAAFGSGPTKSQDLGKAILEDVTVGLEVLVAMGPSDVETERIMATLRRKLEGSGVTLRLLDGARGVVDENLLKRKHSQVDLKARSDRIVQSVSENPSEVEGIQATMDKNAESPSHPTPHLHRQVPLDGNLPRRIPTHGIKTSQEKEKEKKKKGSRYPSVGVRDRGEDGPPWMRRSIPQVSRPTLDGLPNPRTVETNKSPSSTTSVPQTPFTDSGVILKPPGLTGPPLSGPNTFVHGILQHGHASASEFPSTIHSPPLQSPQAPDYGTSYRALDLKNTDVHTRQRRRLSHEMVQPHRNTPQLHQSFDISSATLYDSIQNASPSEPFNANGHEPISFEQNTMSTVPVYGTTPSPYAISSSSASSPFGSVSCPPPTPSYDSRPSMVPHDSSSPTFVSRAPSCQTYHQIGSEYLTSQNKQHEHPMVMGDHSLAITAGSNGILDLQGRVVSPPSALSSPIYEKSQHMMYGPKSSVELGQQLQHQLQYGVSGNQSRLSDGPAQPSVQQQQRLSMDASTSRNWRSTQHYLQPQSQGIIDQTPPQYWPAGGYFS